MSSATRCRNVAHFFGIDSYINTRLNGSVWFNIEAIEVAKRKVFRHSKNAAMVIAFVIGTIAAVLLVANLLTAVTGDRLIALLLLITFVVTLLPLFRGFGIGEDDDWPKRRPA